VLYTVTLGGPLIGRSHLTRPCGSALPLRLAESLFTQPVLTIPEAQRLLGATYPSAQRNVEELVKADILQQVGESSYGKTFVSTEIFQVTGDS